jgi:hypothetical protein
MPINRSYKILFVHIPKCAGTSIEKILDMSTTNEYFSHMRIKNSRIHIPVEKFNEEEYLNCVNKPPQHMTYNEMCKAIDGVDQFFKFSIVRNPYTRLVSEYEYVKTFKNETTTFEKFIQCLDYEKSKRIELFHGHLETQTCYLENFDGKIYQFENIQECIDDLKQYSPVTIIPHANKREYTKPYMEYYTQELLEKVQKFYQEDFINFNYSI